MISSLVFITNGPCWTMGSPMGMAAMSTTSVVSGPTQPRVTPSPATVSVTVLCGPTLRPEMSASPLSTYLGKGERGGV